MTWVIVRDGDGSWGATALLSIVILVLFLLITPLGKRLTTNRAAGVFAGDS